MAVRPLSQDQYIDRLRALFAESHDVDLEASFATEGAGMDAFFVRSANYRLSMVPWIEDVFPLAGANVLEIGCGTGAATFPVAYSVRRVEAYDIDDQSLALAKERAAKLGVGNALISKISPQWALPENIDGFLKGRRAEFDVVLLPAVLEHMLIAERVASLRRLWQLLKPGGVMVIYDTPNRLHPYDQHSFRLPFADWLPPELMLMYLDRSPRTELIGPIVSAPDTTEALYRTGRGVSYHEFELAIGLSAIEVVNDGFSPHMTHREPLSPYTGMIQLAFDQHASHVHRGFARDWLELVLRKKWDAVETVRTTGATNQLLDGRRPALVLTGADASAEYALPSGSSMLEVEVLKHRWSADLVIRDGGGSEIARFDLYCVYHRLERLSIALPKGTTGVVVTLKPNPKSEGCVAWLLGVGATDG
jgi:2-polyprenyl-3-methyl-5-hydroxy-6-metoxy-1,4-benzoquinol methylase